MTVVALLVGMNVGGSGVDLVGLYTLAVFLNLAAILWATGVALRLRTDAGRSRHADAGLPGPLLRTGLRPARPAAGLDPRRRDVNPITRVLEAGRGFLAGSPTEVGLAFALAAALVVAFGFWALRGLRSAEHAG